MEQTIIFRKIKKMVNELKTVAEFDEAIKSKCVIDFTATWCPPCQFIGPKFVALADGGEYAGVTFHKLDVDANDQASAKAGISCMPTFQFYHNGTKVDELQGADENTLKTKLAAHAAR